MIDIEKSFERLESINEAIRNPEISLNKATELFEEGIQLSKAIEKELTETEQKIEVLINSPEENEGEAQFQLFSEE